MPQFAYDDVAQLVTATPRGAALVGIEMGGQALETFAHPERCVYVLGAEDEGLPKSVRRACRHVVSLPAIRSASYNVAVAGALVVTSAALGCAVNPATGKRQFSLIGEAQEVEMGRQADAEFRQQLGSYADEGLNNYVSELGHELAATSERPDLPWSFRVVDDPVVNAFALPGGYIYVTRGILTHLSSEAQVPRS